MNNTIAVRGMANVSFWAADVREAKKWYSELLGIAPYFERPNAENPEYIEFRLGDFQHEFGIINRNYAPKSATAGPGGAIVYWHVDDVKATFERLLTMGATEYDPITERGSGFVTASVVDPFGNVLGMMYNPHYVEVFNALNH